MLNVPGTNFRLYINFGALQSAATWVKEALQELEDYAVEQPGDTCLAPALTINHVLPQSGGILSRLRVNPYPPYRAPLLPLRWIDLAQIIECLISYVHQFNKVNGVSFANLYAVVTPNPSDIDPYPGSQASIHIYSDPGAS